MDKLCILYYTIRKGNLDEGDKRMKVKTVFVCSECGTESPKWMGKCPGCGAWNTMEEETVRPKAVASAARMTYSTGRNSSAPKPLSQIESEDEARISTGMTELDRVLGGGLVIGSLVLVGGDPGIGKSTLLLQICEYIGTHKKVLYVSGEESQRQIKLRAERLGITTENLKVYSETDTQAITDCIFKERPDVLIVDSVQTMYNPEISSAPGNITQIRDLAANLMRIAKEESIAVFLVGHVTKEGSIAGPKVLEHIVDCVLYFEGERHQSYRILRAVKNRFGSTNEIGVFEMSGKGLEQIANPSLALLSGRPENAPGSCIVCTMEGTRPVLAEVQALVTPSSFGNPRRMASGVDLSRALMLMAVLEKRAGLHISSYDAYINIVGGLRIYEPAIDMGIVLAIASSFRNTPVSGNVVAIGEIGLTGETRACNFLENRISEAEKLGFQKCIIPASNAARLKKFKKIEVCPIRSVREVIDSVM